MDRLRKMQLFQQLQKTQDSDDDNNSISAGQIFVFFIGVCVIVGGIFYFLYDPVPTEVRDIVAEAQAAADAKRAEEEAAAAAAQKAAEEKKAAEGTGGTPPDPTEPPPEEKTDVPENSGGPDLTGFTVDELQYQADYLAKVAQAWSKNRKEFIRMWAYLKLYRGPDATMTNLVASKVLLYINHTISEGELHSMLVSRLCAAFNLDEPYTDTALLRHYMSSSNASFKSPGLPDVVLDLIIAGEKPSLAQDWKVMTAAEYTANNIHESTKWLNPDYNPNDTNSEMWLLDPMFDADGIGTRQTTRKTSNTLFIITEMFKKQDDGSFVAIPDTYSEQEFNLDSHGLMFLSTPQVWDDILFRDGRLPGVWMDEVYLKLTGGGLNYLSVNYQGVPLSKPAGCPAVGSQDVICTMSGMKTWEEALQKEYLDPELQEYIRYWIKGNKLCEIAPTQMEVANVYDCSTHKFLNLPSIGK